MDMHWMCGNKAYTVCPLAGNGAWLNFPILVIDNINWKMYMPNFDPKWSLLGHAIDKFPQNHRLMNNWELVFASLVPTVGTEAALNWIQSLHHKFNSFVNDSIQVATAVAEELRATRVMSLQNRFVLDVQNAATRCMLCFHSCPRWWHRWNWQGYLQNEEDCLDCEENSKSD